MEIPPPALQGDLRIRLLGDLRLERQGVGVPLPASKRTRALLGYLVATGSAQTRQALCDLLWDGPDDPRAELRWSLTKLRPLLDDVQAQRIAADRERVAFVACGAAIDTVQLRVLLAVGLATAPLAHLEQAAALFAGEFLDGLDLPACYRFHQWCMAERESYAALHRKLLASLVDRLAGDPQRALNPARALAAADPLSESANAALVRVLAALGRARDADAHARQAEAMLRRELGVAPSGELREAMRRVRADLRARTAAPSPATAPADRGDDAGDHATRAPPAPPHDEPPAGTPGEVPAPLVARAAESAAIDAAVGSLAQPGVRPLLLFVGEPGIGKTRLLDLLAERARVGGCRVLQARCFEAEMVRPYGCWIDALRSVPADDVPPDLRSALAPLLRLADSAATPGGDRSRLFDAATAWLLGLAESRPVVLILDDLQWLDEASCSLLHYVIRSAQQPSRLLIAGAARQGEVDDNPWTRGLLHSVARQRRLRQYPLAPLGADELALLLASLAPHADAGSVHRASGGNPLYALTFARAQIQGASQHQGFSRAQIEASSGAPAQGQWSDGLSWESLIAGEMQRLGEPDHELIVWAAAFGQAFRIDLLGAATGVPETALLARLQRFEQRGLLKPSGDGRYDFAHDLVRQAVMRALSQPRRQAIHRNIARVLDAAAAHDQSLYGELVHHASQAEDHALTVRACIATAERCLRVFANAQAANVAQRGLASLAQLPPGRERAGWHIALLRLLIIATATPIGARLPALAEELRQAIETARLIGLDTEAASGLHMLSWLTQNANDTEATRVATLHAEKMSRSADPATRCQQLANTGRCMLEVEADLPQARALVEAAAQQAESLGLTVIELEWAHGLVARWDGDLDAAQASLRRAVELARLGEDRWREFECLQWLAIIQFERGHHADVDALGAEIDAAVARMGKLKAPMNDGLRALARLARASTVRETLGAQQAVDAALLGLRELDDKARLAYVLNQAALLALQHGQPQRAAAAAAEAQDAAEAVRRGTEVLAARALRALAACAANRPEEAADGLRENRYAQGDPIAPSARARWLLERADEALHSNAGSNAGAAHSDALIVTPPAN